MKELVFKYIRFLTFILLLVHAFSAHSQEDSIKQFYIPNHITTQFAGYTGFISVGAGYTYFKDRIRSTLLYGYVPKSIGEVAIHTLSLKNTISLKKIHQYTFYTGGSINFDLGQNSMLRIPGRYPSGYYKTNSFHFPLFIGISKKNNSDYNILKHLEYYLEFGTLAVYLYYFVDSGRNRVGNKIFSFTLGLHFNL